MALVLGENILAARGRFSWRERASQYIVKGSSSAGGAAWDDQPAKVIGGRQVSIDDDEINRYRPKILVNEDSLTVGGASTRGDWYKARMMGKPIPRKSPSPAGAKMVIPARSGRPTF